MALKLMYITNKPEVARIAEASGVDWIFVDLEIIDKALRQGGMDTVQSRHTLDDVKAIKQSLDKAKLLVRCNHIYDGSEEEIDTIINNGADIVMLPYFKTVEEVKQFISFVGGRAETCLLLETAEAAEIIDDILEVPGIDMIHIGLNDLHLSMNKTFLFELLADGTVDRLAEKIKAKGIPFGFGGIAQLNDGLLPGVYVLREHYRLGSTMAILGRSFCNSDHIKDLGEIQHIFDIGIRSMRVMEEEIQTEPASYFMKNHEELMSLVNRIVQQLKSRKSC